MDFFTEVMFFQQFSFKQSLSLTARFITPKLVNIRSLRGIHYTGDLVKMWEPKLANFCKEMYTKEATEGKNSEAWGLISL